MPVAKGNYKICSNPNCIHNGEPQPLSNFNKNKSRKDGYQYQCKDCEHSISKKYRDNNSEKVKLRHEKYYENNKQKCNSKKIKNMNEPAKYDMWIERIGLYEECRRDPKNPELLQVRCKKSTCRNWFNPTYQEVNHRWSSINNDGCGERNFYCSDFCKRHCAVFGQKIYLKGQSPRDIRHSQAEFRKLVIKQNGCVCERCGKSAEDYPDLKFVCHHIDPVKVNPIESADIDNGMILCEDCHHWVHTHIPGCSYAELRKCVLKK